MYNSTRQCADEFTKENVERFYHPVKFLLKFAGKGRFLERAGRLKGESLVGSQDLVHPATELGDTGVDTGSGGRAVAASPGNDTNQGPRVVLLADQRSTVVTLRQTPQQLEC